MATDKKSNSEGQRPAARAGKSPAPESQSIADNGKIHWPAPHVVKEEAGSLVIEYRDCVATCVEGKVIAYFDKDKSITLLPADGDTWSVSTESGPVDTKWRGSIELSGIALTVSQVHNCMQRTFFPDGKIVTSYSASKVVEESGKRTTVHQDGTSIEENLETGRLIVLYDDRKATQNPDKSWTVEFTDGSGIVVHLNEQQQVLSIDDNNGRRDIVYDGNEVVEVRQSLAGKVVRTIKREDSETDGATGKVPGKIWTDNGKIIMDAASGEPLNLCLRVDQEGNIRFLDLAPGGRQRPGLIMPANGPIYEDGRLQILPGSRFDASLLPLLDHMSSWDRLVAEGEGFSPEAPPGYVEAPCGMPYVRVRAGKPMDMRVARCKDAGDGAVVYEYHGRHNNVPYYAKEVTAYDGSVLGRTIVYGQALDLVFRTKVRIVSIKAVVTIDCEFEGGRRFYRSLIRTADGKEEKFYCQSR